MKPFEIFPVGVHTDSRGRKLPVTRDMLLQIARDYSAEIAEAPLVVGHPKTDDPAYGWAERFSVRGDMLVAHPKQVGSEFSNMVQSGSFKNRSISLYAPNDPSNPKPGSWYPRHIGFLGAQAPAIKGLKAVEFSESDESYDFMHPLDGAMDSIGITRRFLSSLKNLLMMDPDILDALRPTPAISSDYSEEDAPTQKHPKKKEPDMAKKNTSVDFSEQEKALKKREDALKEREDKVKADSVAFAEAAKAARAGDDKALLDTLEESGKVTPGLKAGLMDFMAELPHETTFEFSQADGSKEKQTPRDFFRSLLSGAKTQIDFSEVSESDGVGDDVILDARAMSQKATAYFNEQKKVGVTLTYSEAVEHVKREASAA